MIRLDHVSKGFRTTPGAPVQMLLHDVSLQIPQGVSVGLLGRNGVGKTTLLDMISGLTLPDRGKIHVGGSVSWPMGFSGSLHGDMTGLQNTRFVARIYGVDSGALVNFVQDFAGLGAHFNAPVRGYSAGMRARLAFGLSIGIPFDTYLIDEITAVGDAAFRAKSRAYFLARLHRAGAIVVNHTLSELRSLCTAGLVLHDGTLRYFPAIEDAIAAHTAAT
ncbi:capsular polysaccharide transport system ATP-binding protein [Ketogulonicigenium robustum]|uniref:Capsular polysaccharide transport system ATP-binding protein n=1 Tax=Ketogulonicigenium robustum TaxID=92947 RepID=A0A1W6P240_9RHOB|nr:ABC transporter ATP-binding protein [Ketogulonicigenium robustum]ARO15483.1 capsular polysaccharide transport system ATP-binding protein [Ketogulonicigenium robustum]